MPHFNGLKSSEQSLEHKTRNKISRELSSCQKYVEILLTQSNDDEEETKFYYARLRRQLIGLRLLSAKLAVMPDAHSVLDGYRSPLARAKEVLTLIEKIESSVGYLKEKYDDLPLDYRQNETKL